MAAGDRTEIRLPANGAWWLDRDALELDDAGQITVVIAGYAPGPLGSRRDAGISGTPDTLRKLAAGIVAHCDSAEMNTPPARPALRSV